MSPRLKSILLLTITLLIGGLLGALLNARLAEQRFERLASLRSERGFMRYIESVIDPVDDAQRDQVRAILQTSAERMARHREQSWRDARMILDSTRVELQAVLTPEQMQRLDEHMEARRPRHGPRPDRGRPDVERRPRP